MTRYGTDQNRVIHLYTHERSCPKARSARGRTVRSRKHRLALAEHLIERPGLDPAE